MDKAIARALSILQIVTLTDVPVRLTSVAEAAGLSKSTVHRQLQTLMELGYVTQEADTGRYAPTLKLWELGSAVVVADPVKRAAAPFLHALHREVGHTVSLLAPDGDDVIYLDKLISPRSAHFNTRPGSRVAAPLTAGGQAMLAYDPAAREKVLRAAQRVQRRRPFDPEAFLASLPAIRMRGYAVNRLNPEVVSVGCALLARGGQAAGAISISASADSIDGAEETRIAAALVAACSRLAEQVGRL